MPIWATMSLDLKMHLMRMGGPLHSGTSLTLWAQIPGITCSPLLQYYDNHLTGRFLSHDVLKFTLLVRRTVPLDSLRLITSLGSS